MVKRVGLLAAMLTLVLGSGTVAQEPSPEPPPWFGGRVEMPEHGFAVMVPDGWLAFDLAGDVEEQARAATAAIYPDASEAAIESSAGYVRSLQDRGQLAVLDPSAFSNCTLLVGPAVGRDLESLASGMYDFVSNDERVLHAEPPQAMTLPAGLARLVTHGGEAYESAAYMGEGAGKAFMVECRAAERPEDDWLSIVETLEWLPASEPRHASSPPWFGGESVEMSEDGFAMTVPDGWAAIDLTRDVDEQVRILVSALDPIASDEKLQAHVEAWSGEAPGQRLALVNTSNGDMCDLVVLPDAEADLDRVADRLFAGLSNDDEVLHAEPPMVVTLPAGSARLVTHGGEAYEIATYVIQRTGTAVLFLCQGETRPDDDWLSIAEALEPMPAEE